MQRIAIILCLGITLGLSGCTPMGRPGRGLAGDPSAPSARNRAVPTQMSSRDDMRSQQQPGMSKPGVDYDFRLDSASARSWPRDNENPGQPGDYTQKQANSAETIPVVGKESAPPTSTIAHGATGHVCDGSCGVKHSVVGPNGVIGLPQFRLSELTEEDKRQLENSIVTSNPVESPAVQQVAAQAAAVATEPVESITVTPKPKDIPVATPVQTTSPADFVVQSAAAVQEDSLRSNPQPQLSSSRIIRESSPTAQNPGASNPSNGDMVTMIPGHARMQVQVVDDSDSDSLPEGSANTRLDRELSLPKIDKKLAASLRAQVSEETNPAHQALTKPLDGNPKQPAAAPFPVEARMNPPAAPNQPAQAAADLPLTKSGPQKPQLQTTSQNPVKPEFGSAESFGIRVDPNLLRPSTTPAPTSTPVVPATTPTITLPAKFSSPSGAMKLPEPNAPPKADRQVKPASFQQPASTGFTAPMIMQSAEEKVAPPIDVTVSNNMQSMLSGNKSPFPWIGNQAASETAVDEQSTKFVMPNKTGLNSNAIPPGSSPVSKTRQLPVSKQPETMLATMFHANAAALTTEIMGFGQYLPMDTSALRGSETVLFYCELANFESRQENGEFKTLLDSKLVVTDSEGNVVQEESFPRLNDASQSRRTDFYMYVPFRLNDLPTGKYKATLQIRDAQSDGTATAVPLDFQVE